MQMDMYVPCHAKYKAFKKAGEVFWVEGTFEGSRY